MTTRTKDRLADPFSTSLVVLAALILGGGGTLWLTWRSVAARDVVAEQIAFVVSGGFGGVGVVGFAAGILIIQARRRAEAHRRDQIERVLDRANELLEVAQRASHGEANP